MRNIGCIEISFPRVFTPTLKVRDYLTYIVFVRFFFLFLAVFKERKRRLWSNQSGCEDMSQLCNESENS